MAINGKTGARNDLVIQGFPRGYNNVNDATTLDDEELYICENVEIDSNGGLVSRPPIVKIAALPVSGQLIKFYGYYVKADGTLFCVVSCTNGTYLYDTTLNTWARITTIVASGAVQYQNKLYICSLTTAGGYWNGTSFTTLGSGSYPMPKGSQITLHKGRFFMISNETGYQNSRIYWSRINDAVNSTTVDQWDWVAGNDFQDVSPGDGQQITKLLAGREEIFIFRSRSTFYFKYDVSIVDSAVLQLLDANVGADSENAVAQYEFSYIVLSNGRVYRFVSYQFYPLNDPMRLELRPGGGSDSLPVKSAISTLGRRAIIWYGGITYVLNLDDGTWSTWDSPTTEMAYVVIAPRKLGNLSPDIAYGISGSASTSIAGLLRITDSYNSSDSEEITCTIQTKAFDFGSPDTWKRQFYWDADVYTARNVVGTSTPVQLSNVYPGWDDMNLKTWDQLEAGTWDNILEKSPEIITTIVYPASEPYRVNVAFQKDMRFRRCSYKIQLTTDGTTATGPVRMVSLSVHAALKKVIPTIIQ